MNSLAFVLGKVEMCSNFVGGIVYYFIIGLGAISIKRGKKGNFLERVTQKYVMHV